jgi:archaellum component FlaC
MRKRPATVFFEKVFSVKNENNYKVFRIFTKKVFKKQRYIKFLDDKINKVDDKINRVDDKINRADDKINKIDLVIKKYLYRNMIDIIYKRVCNGNNIRVGFLVVYDSVFPASPLYEKMLQDDIFEPFIVVIPDIVRGEKNMFFQMEKTYRSLSKKYKNIKLSYDRVNNSFVDFSDSMDMVCSANAYDLMTNKLYGLQYLFLKDILSFYVTYGWYGNFNFDSDLVKDEFHNTIWKIFLESDRARTELSNKMYNLGTNLYVSGYCKMDPISGIKRMSRARKCIIIAPHHTILHWEGGLNISTFLKYYEFFVELPKKYPNIDFIFRPHPLLFVTLKRSDVWGEDKVQKYLEDLTKNPNVTYDSNADYFDLFVNSDALIHDCGSFLAEYMYTHHPQCYLVKDEAAFSTLGKELLKHTYMVYSQQGILEFIDNVVINGNDTMKNDRINFANKYLKINYPHATDKIIEILKKELRLL